MYHQDDSIYALATAVGTAALAIIRVSGEGCTEQIAKIFSHAHKLRQAPSNTIVYGRLYSHPEGVEKRELIEEVMISRFVAPHGYTGEESLEITLHGSMLSTRRVCGALAALGLRQAEPGEFSFRAFMNGKMELTQVEAVHELIKAKTAAAQSYALRRLQGELGARINDARDGLSELMMPLALSLDYPEDELDLDLSFDWERLAKIRRDLEWLASTHRRGNMLREGYSIVFAGATNAGKSSLFNKLVGQDRAIVSPIAGTTRDYLESWIEIGGVPVRIVDTAGLRTLSAPSSDPIEQRGIERSNTMLKEADLILYVVDNEVGLSSEDTHIIEMYKDRCLVLCNKGDLAPMPACPAEWRVIGVSALADGPIEELEDFLSENLEGDEAIVLESPRQAELIARCIAAIDEMLPSRDAEILAMYLRLAIDSLGEMVGHISTEDMFDKIFAHFCVGK